MPIGGLAGKGKPIDDGEKTKQDNVWYFTNAYADGGNGSKSSPFGYNNFNQSQIAYVLNNPRGSSPAEFDFQQGGTYNMEPVNPVFLYDGQSIYGRDNNYIEPAQGINRPTLIGALTLPNENRVDSVQLNSGINNFTTGVTILSGANNIIIDNTDVGIENSTVGAYSTGVSMTNATVIIENNSHIYGYAEGNLLTTVEAVGVNMTSGGSLTVKNSTVTGIGNAGATTLDDTGDGIGIKADGSANNINIVGSIITGQGEGVGAGDNDFSENGYGILVGRNDYRPISGSNTLPPIANTNINIIQGSVVQGFGIGNGSTTADDSGNGYGILVGYGFVGDFVSELKILNNKISIDNSTVLGEARSSNLTYSGNTYTTDNFTGGKIFDKDGIIPW